eukprot:TRINITY_DN65130_c0_g1_i1.p1 TRINITY_DN65130_c0_g1~~TRINITY_DN65130_c0_g1_i1.p1  ORF type:complete len:347 (+),score=47.33 TRINITY_DN65130_c0_g1_i1:83-1123(+)
MEKFRQFADSGTGVNPFLPPWSNYKPSILMRLVKVLFFPIALVRLSLFIVAVLYLALVQGLCMLIPVAALRRPVQYSLTYFGCHFSLISLGVFTASEALSDNRRLKLPVPQDSGRGRPFSAKSGALVFVNHQSLTDVLYLGMKLCPVFVFAASDGTPVQLSLIGAILRAGARRPVAPLEGKADTLQAISQRARDAWQPVVVFAEGARTNGGCVLAWRPSTFAGTESLIAPVGCCLASLAYSKTGAYTPHHVVGTTFRHMFWMCLQPFHTLSTVWLPQAEVEKAIKGKPQVEQIGLVRTLLVRMIPEAVEVDVPASKHVEFMAYWDASQRKGYTKAEPDPKKLKKNM